MRQTGSAGSLPTSRHSIPRTHQDFKSLNFRVSLGIVWTSLGLNFSTADLICRVHSIAIFLAIVRKALCWADSKPLSRNVSLRSDSSLPYLRRLPCFANAGLPC